MSRLRALRRLPPIVGGGGGALVNTETPQLSGIPRAGQSASIWAGNYSGGTPNLYRYKTYRDGSLVNNVSQASSWYNWDLVTADAGTALTATVEASSDSGSTWSTPVSAYLAFTYPADLIEPSSIPAISVTRTSSSAVTPMTFDLTAATYASYQWEIEVYASDITTLKYRGYKAVSQAELQGTFTMDLTGATGPIPSPAMPSLLATDCLRMRLTTQDWDEGSRDDPVEHQGGMASNWVYLTPTDRAGSRYYTLEIDNVIGGWSGGAVLAGVEVALTVGGADIALNRDVLSAASYNLGGANAISHFNDGDSATYAGLAAGSPPVSLVIDFGWNFVAAQLRLIRFNNAAFDNQVPTDFKFGASNSAGTFSGSPFVKTGETWSTYTQAYTL